MKKIKMVVALISTIALSACATPEEQLKLDKNQCASYGYKVGSDKFSDCVKDIQLQRNEMENNKIQDMKRAFDKKNKK